MIFSLFGKKDGRSNDRKRGSSPATPPSRPASAGAVSPAGRTVDPREVARLTAAKIDVIESEMIAPPRPLPVAGARSAPVETGQAGNVYVPSGAARTGSMVPAGPPPARPAGAARMAASLPSSPVASSAASAVDPDTSVILGEGGSAASMEVAGTSLPPAFEEVAVLYANGQADDGVTILRQAIRDDELGGYTRQGWSMLFDLYQASGRQHDFESLAIDYSARFESSPPTWDPVFDAPASQGQRPVSASAPATVALPPALDAQVVKQLEQIQRFAQRNRGVVLDARTVRSVDCIGADLLHRVLVAFAKAQRDLVVQGAESLLAVVADSIEAGRRDPSQACWLLQLELLRLLGRQQAFEDLSIDYCVTYEVSPPPWEPLPAMLRTIAPGEAPGGSADAEAASPGESGFALADDTLMLRGDLDGRAAVVLAALRSHAADRAEIVIDCRALRRVDFVAAGELLNEVVALRTGGKYLVFKDVNHLVAALFAVMGIPDLAEIRLRRH